MNIVDVDIYNTSTTTPRPNTIARQNQRSTVPTCPSRCYNVDLGLSNSACNTDSVDIDRMEKNYNFIAGSINNLAMQARIRRVDEINADTIRIIIEKNDLEAAGETELANAYQHQIRDLETKRGRAESFDNHHFTNIEVLTSNISKNKES